MKKRLPNVINGERVPFDEIAMGDQIIVNGDLHSVQFVDIRHEDGCLEIDLGSKTVYRRPDDITTRVS